MAKLKIRNIINDGWIEFGQLDARTLTGGTGIAPIGDLSADRTINIDQAAPLVWTAKTLVAASCRDTTYGYALGLRRKGASVADKYLPLTFYSSNDYVEAAIGTRSTGADGHADLYISTRDAGGANNWGEAITVKLDGKVCVAGTAPDHAFDVKGNIGLAASGYINWGGTDGDSGYGFYDDAGTLQYKNSGGTWANIGGGVPTSRTLTAGSFLTGGGDLSANRRFDFAHATLGTLLASSFYTETEVDTIVAALAASGVPESRALTGGTGIAAIGDLSANRYVNIDQSADLAWTGQETFSSGGHRFHKSNIAFAADQFITDYGSQPGLGAQANTKRYFNTHYATTAMSMLSKSYSVQPIRGSVYHTTKGVANVFSAYVALDTAETAAEAACYYGLTHLEAAGAGADPLAAVADWWLNIDVDNAAVAQIINVDSKVASPTTWKGFLYMNQGTNAGYNQPLRRAFHLHCDADESIINVENRNSDFQCRLEYVNASYDYVKFWVKGKVALNSFTNATASDGDIWYDGTNVYARLGGVSTKLDKPTGFWNFGTDGLGIKRQTVSGAGVWPTVASFSDYEMQVVYNSTDAETRLMYKYATLMWYWVTDGSYSD